MKFNIFSLKYQIVIIVFILEVIILAFLLGKTLTFIESNSLKDMELRQNVIMQLVKNIATDGLFSEEYDDLQLQIELINKNDEVSSISITNMEGIILAHTDFSLVGTIQPVWTPQQNLKFKTEIVKNFGKINIVFSSQLLEIRIIKARNFGISIAVSGTLIIAFASILFGYLLTRKLIRLSLAMQLFQKDNEYVEIKIKGRDEVSELAKQFNILTKDINYHMKMIENEKILLESRVSDRTKELQILNSELEVIASTDHLTNLKNRAYLENILQQELLTFSENGNSIFSIILLDIDHFKSVNDSFGHDIGDLVLVTLANILKTNVRESEIVGRWGGEEFIIICANTKLSNSEKIAEKLRDIIEKFQFPVVKKITCSFGISSCILNDSIDSIFKRADLGLYTAKDKGRNCVISITENKN
ncbi:MAG: diguanylate cyclase [Thiohalomonadales bacterium]